MVEPSADSARRCAGPLLRRVVDDQLAIMQVITERHRPTHPHAFGFGCGELVPDALAGDLPLELGEGQQHIQGQPTHAGRGVEALRHADERGAAAVEDFDDLGEVGEAAGQPVDLVDDDDVHPALLDVS